MAKEHISSLYLKSHYIWRYLGTVWDLLPVNERNFFAEYWKGIEQVFGDQLVRGYEYDLSVSINDITTFMTQRWNRYNFDDTTRSDAPATFTSKVDLGNTVNLTTNYLIAFNIRSIVTGEIVSYEVDCRGNFAETTTSAEIVQAINAAVGWQVVATAYAGSLLLFTTQTKGPTAVLEFVMPSDVTHNGSLAVLGLKDSELPLNCNVYPWRYVLPQTHRIWRIATLQDKIRDLSITKQLVSDVDYILTPEQYIYFKEQPVEVMWARDTRVNERLPAYNYGWLVDYVDTDRTPDDYLFILQGLWFAYWMGPRPEFIRRCLCLLFGLPVSTGDGVVSAVEEAPDSGSTGRVYVVDEATGDTLEYVIPVGLAADVKVGDTVVRFTSLSTGIEIFDKVNRPGFVTTDIGRNNLGRFLTKNATWGLGDTDETKALKMLEEHTFLPQINVFSFVRPNISIKQIRQFLDAIKPLHKTYHLQMIVAAPDEAIDIQEKFRWLYDVNITPTLDSNLWMKQFELTREEYEAVVSGDLSATELHLDSEVLQFSESVTIEVSDSSGPRPDLGSVYAPIV
jgi:hypothetical protein